MSAGIRGRLASLMARRDYASFALTVAAAVVLFFSNDNFYLYLADTAIIYAIGGLALDWLTGRAGQVSIGNAAFLAVGAYTAALISRESWGSFELAVVVSLALGAVLGLLTGLPSLRIGGIHLALATLALQFIVVFIANSIEVDTNNVGGFYVRTLTVGPSTVNTPRDFFLFLLVALLICVLLLRNMYSRLPGRMWQAIREDEAAAATFGINTIRWKLAAFTGSSAMVSFAGCLFGYFIRSVSSETFTLDLALSFVAILVIGGIGSIPGVIFGAVFVVAAPEIISSQLDRFSSSSIGSWLEPRSSLVSTALYGVILLVLLVLRPSGVAGLVRDGWEWSRAKLDRRMPPLSPGIAPTRPATMQEPRRVEPPVADPILVIRDLSCTYQSGAAAVVSLNLEVSRGSITAIVGRNGAGKSTLLRSVTGFLGAERARVTGTIECDGRDITKFGPSRTAAYGVILVPERDKIFPDLTVEEHFWAVGRRDGLDRADSAIFDVLRKRRKSRAGYLSGGERQLLALCMAACLEPRLLLIDEMSLGLAPAVTETVITAVSELTALSGTSVLVVEQSLRVARELTDRIYLMKDGSLTRWSDDLKDAILTDHEIGELS